MLAEMLNAQVFSEPPILDVKTHHWVQTSWSQAATSSRTGQQGLLGRWKCWAVAALLWQCCACKRRLGQTHLLYMGGPLTGLC